MSAADFKNENVEVVAPVFGQLISGPFAQPMSHWFLVGSGRLVFFFFSADVCAVDVYVLAPLLSALLWIVLDCLWKGTIMIITHRREQ